MDGALSNEVRFRAKVNDRVPAHELFVWADEIERLEKELAGALEVIERRVRNQNVSVLNDLEKADV